MHEAERVIQWLEERGQAIGGTGSTGNDGVAGLERIVIYAIYHGGIDVLGTWRRNQHLACALLNMNPGFLLGGEGARTFKHHIHTDILPWQFGGVTRAESPYLVAIDNHAIAVRSEEH